MQYIMIGFFRCACGKIHCYGGITRTTKCTCGASLWDRIWK